MKTFRCNFGGGIIATMSCPDEFPEGGTMSYQKTTWEGHLSAKVVKRIFPRYKQWVLDSSQIMSNEWNKVLLYAFLLPNDGMEVYRIQPNLPPELVNT